MSLNNVVYVTMTEKCKKSYQWGGGGKYQKLDIFPVNCHTLWSHLIKFDGTKGDLIK